MVVNTKRGVQLAIIDLFGLEHDLDRVKRKLYHIHGNINTFVSTTKFTPELDHDNKPTTFLDTKITITNGGIVKHLYRKETDRIQYLLPSLSHPRRKFKNVPYSLTLLLNE